MRAAAVRPVARPQAFFGRTLLQEQLAGRVEDKQREGTVKDTFSIVAGRLIEGACFSINAIDENKRFILERDNVLFGLVFLLCRLGHFQSLTVTTGSQWEKSDRHLACDLIADGVP